MLLFKKLQSIFLQRNGSSENSRTFRSYPLIAAVILVLGVTIRIYYWERNCQIPLRDGINYLMLIEGWHTESIEFIKTYFARHQASIPLLFIGLSQSLMSFQLSAEVAGTLVNISCGAGTLFLLWRIGRQLWPDNQEAGCALLVFGAFSPTLVELSSNLLRGSCYMFFATAVFLCALHILGSPLWAQNACSKDGFASEFPDSNNSRNLSMRRQRICCLGWAFGGGICSAFMTLSRYEGFEVYFLFFLLLLYCFRNKKYWKMLVFSGLVWLGGSLLGYILFFGVYRIPSDIVWDFFERAFITCF